MKVQKISKIASAAMIAAVLLPGVAMAHGNKDKKIEARAKATNEFGIKVWDDNDRRHIPGAVLPSLFMKGTVAAVSSTGFTMTTKDNKIFTVNTANAKLIQVPRTPITLANIKVNDRVSVDGTKNGTTIDALVVYSLDANVSPAAAKGTVTAVSGNTLTVQTKNNTNVSVKTEANTQVVKNGQEATPADITTGTNVKIFGLWDRVLNVFTALKIKIK